MSRPYRQTANSSRRQLTLLRDDGIEHRVLKRACDEIRDRPTTAPLWIFRVAQHQRAGRLPYRKAWDRLYEAGLRAGMSEQRITRHLYSGFALANAFKSEPPELRALAGGLQ